MIHRYVTIFLLVWLANECCALANVSLPDNDQVPNQELILPDEIQAWSTEPISLNDGLPPSLFTLKWRSVIGVLDGQYVCISYDYDQQMNTLCIRDALNRPVEGYQLDIQDRPV